MRVACIGLGLIGSRLAERVALSGHSVTGFDLVADPGLSDVTMTQSIADCVAGAEIVLLSLPTSGDSIEVTLGSGGVAENGIPGTVIVDTTTAAPADSVYIGKELSSLPMGFIDATISGNADIAQRGELTVMAGGADVDIDRAQPVLESFATAVLRVGPVGSGARMKLIVNHALGIHRVALAETLVAAERGGLDLELVLQVLRESAAYSRAMDLWGDRMAAGEHEPPKSRLRQTLKDARLIVAQAESDGVSPDLARMTLAILEEGASAGLADADNSAVIEVLRRRIKPDSTS